MPPSKPLNTENTALAEQFFGQVSDSIQLVFDLTSRIDERVKMLIEQQNDLEGRVEKLLEMHQSSNSRLVLLESKEYPSLKEDLARIKENVLTIALISKEVEGLQSKIQTLEIKSEMIAMKMGTHDNRWLLAFDTIWKLGLMLVAGYILYKLGLQAPPVP